ncbi:MAG: hypothetical protein Q9220_000257 [cf. Caloplaca sp. 1 TL-2023]
METGKCRQASPEDRMRIGEGPPKPSGGQYGITDRYLTEEGKEQKKRIRDVMEKAKKHLEEEIEAERAARKRKRAARGGRKKVNDSEEAEDSDGTEDSEGADDSEEVEDSEGADDSDNTEDSDGAEDSEEVDDSEGAEESEESEESSGAPEKKKAKTT